MNTCVGYKSELEGLGWISLAGMMVGGGGEEAEILANIFQQVADNCKVGQ